MIEAGVEFNIVDTGYGVSQILPVLAQIWWARERTVTPNLDRTSLNPTISSVPTILAIEQPELHLHPAHQALLADAFVGGTNTSKSEAGNRPVHFLIETHSETLINRLGELVAGGQLAANDVHIVIFEPEEAHEDQSIVRISQFSDDGTLKNWPFGFFQPGV